MSSAGVRKRARCKVELLLMYNTAKIVRNMVSLLAEYHKEQPELFGPRGGAGGAGGRGEVPQVVATAAEMNATSWVRQGTGISSSVPGSQLA